MGIALAKAGAAYIALNMMLRAAPKPIELSLAVVGLAHSNDDKAKSNRQFEARICAPGETVHLVRDPRNAHDPSAVAVFSARHIQLGYLSAERCGWIGAKIGEGQIIEAVFQSVQGNVAIIRARIGGGAPTLPLPRPSDEPAIDDDDFYPDPPAPEWGA